MQVRVIELNDNQQEEGKLISYFYIDDCVVKLDELVRTFYEIKKIQETKTYHDDIGIELNVQDIADCIGDWYEIENITLNIPSINGDILPYLAVYVKSMY